MLAIRFNRLNQTAVVIVLAVDQIIYWPRLHFPAPGARQSFQAVNVVVFGV